MSAVILIRRIFLSWSIIFAPLVAALAIDHWSHLTAQVLAHLWLLAFVIVLTMKRQPCHYGSYTSWYRDRDNWWTAFP